MEMVDGFQGASISWNVSPEYEHAGKHSSCVLALGSFAHFLGYCLFFHSSQLKVNGKEKSLYWPIIPDEVNCLLFQGTYFIQLYIFVCVFSTFLLICSPFAHFSQDGLSIAANKGNYGKAQWKMLKRLSSGRTRRNYLISLAAIRKAHRNPILCAFYILLLLLY
jgi:hypothetical protein